MIDNRAQIEVVPGLKFLSLAPIMACDLGGKWLITEKCKYVIRNTGKGRKNEEKADSYEGAIAGVDINTLIMEQYLALSREYQAPGMVKLEIGGNVNFEIKSQFMRELRDETFSRNKNEDAHDHVDRVLNIVSLFNIPGVSQDAVLLRVFPFTLTGTAKRWVDRLTPRVINNWDLLKKAFIQRSLSSRSNTDGLAAIVSKLDNLGRDMKKLKENVHAIQVGCQICEGPHFDKECPPGYYTRTDNRPPYGEKRPSLEELMNKHLEESARRSTKMNEWITKLQESASVNVMPRNIFEYLKLANLTNTNMLVEMADMTKKAPLGKPFLATIHAEINVFDKEISLGTNNDRVSYDMEKRDHNFTIPTEKIFMIKSDLDNRPLTPASSNNKPRNLHDRFQQLGGNSRDRLEA
ncbi:hypothetical protein Tco_0941710 [Tanacetum coccineum]|uniref:Retrotransposon gag domain-containing protein n=1 Tax=Tanacetum coccineum TaxID=301880 RepID=A0ABQ5DS57_9ASTR